MAVCFSPGFSGDDSNNSVQVKERVISQDEVLWIVYLIQFITGVLGNSFLFCIYTFNYTTGYRKRSIDPILIYLAFTNTMLLLFRGIPEMIRVWKWQYFLNDIGCKLITYLQTACRGLSLSSTSLLSVFQAITISPSSLFWAEIKARAPKWVLPCCLTCWIFNLMIDVFVPVYVTSSHNRTIKGSINMGFCSLDINAIRPLKTVIWKSLYDFIFVGIMLCSSIYMVILLYSHHQQVKHIHHTSLGSRPSPEIQATKSILLLVSTFVCFSTVSGPFIITMESSEGSISWPYYISAFMSVSFQTISPFVLLSSDTQMLRSSCVF
ncbi:vomeronasal type-1 receptor 4-like [Dromiciops gliroides]|uniref:vomeronasal type-1 receptor 4-like n=1 Tax=Dromiciops gliroides TaxID=33562 RepID=UPI001CC6804F|nr:vomeronasal type-1 receptor 4-like [Dromiciops gliroides]